MYTIEEIKNKTIHKLKITVLTKIHHPQLLSFPRFRFVVQNINRKEKWKKNVDPKWYSVNRAKNDPQFNSIKATLK